MDKLPKTIPTDYYEAIRAMPDMWMGSINKWYAIYKSLQNLQTIALWHLHNKTGQAFWYGMEKRRIYAKYGIEVGAGNTFSHLKYQMIGRER